MQKFVTRSARPDDLKTLLEFEQGIVSAERPFDVTLKDGEIHYYDIAYMISAPNVEVAVVTCYNEIIGSGYARIEESKIYLRHQQHAYLGFMYVKPEYRGKGVNKLIIEALKSWALSKNITELRLEVYDGNIPAVKAYEKFGFEKLLVTMRMGV